MQLFNLMELVHVIKLIVWKEGSDSTGSSCGCLALSEVLKLVPPETELTSCTRQRPVSADAGLCLFLLPNQTV